MRFGGHFGSTKSLSEVKRVRGRGLGMLRNLFQNRFLDLVCGLVSLADKWLEVGGEVDRSMGETRSGERGRRERKRREGESHMTLCQ